MLLIVNANVQHKVPKNISVAFHNGSSYDNHFVIKQLAKDFNGYFNCIGENTEKYISFSVTVLKERDTVNKKQKEKNWCIHFKIYWSLWVYGCCIRKTC